MARKTWSEEETTFLVNNWGFMGVAELTKALDRSDNSVVLRAKRMKLGPISRAGASLVANQVAKLLKVDIHTVTDYWIARCDLKVERKVMRTHFEMQLICFSDLLEWLKNNQDKWDSRRVELYAFGPEEFWLQEKRKADDLLPKNRLNKWSLAEDSRLITLKAQKLTHKAIGELMGRSEDSVERRWARIRAKQKSLSKAV